MPTDSYRSCIEWLFAQFPSYQNIGAPAYKPGLENITALAQAFGNPQNDLRFIHVAGSNGKGSICSMMASIYKESGLKTGLFTSPHLVDFKERIRINGELIREDYVVDFCEQIKTLKLSFEPSFFEITWIMALCYFKAQGCNLVIVEVGLGGRLDSTNIIQPELSIISNISLEHTQFLGNSIQEIAFEKGGIIKNHTPVITAERSDEALSVFRELALKNDAELVIVEGSTLPNAFPLLGDYQKWNWACVEKAIARLQDKFFVDQKAKEAGLINLQANTGFLARLQVVQHEPRIIYDVSHNADGIEKTLRFLRKDFGAKLFLVYGTSADKNLDEIFPLFPSENVVLFTEFANQRSASIATLTKKAEQYKIDGLFFQNPKMALDLAKTLANKEDTILVFGSFFLIHDFLK